MTREEILQIAKPVLFNTKMVKAILDGRKTVTRRLVKDGKSTPKCHGKDKFYDIVDHLNDDYKHWYAGFYNDNNIFYIDGKKLIDAIYFQAPYKPGDVLYVRETFAQAAAHIFWYKADNKDFLSKCKAWKPSIHMPKEAARIFLKVKDVRVERLQEITEEKAEREGIRAYSKDGKLYKYAVTDDWWIEFHRKHRKSFIGSWWQDMPRTAKEAFSYLWNSTIKKADLAIYGWDANPYVWVIEFEKLEVE